MPPRTPGPDPSRNDLLVTLIQGIREAIQQTADRQTAHERHCLEREDRAQAVRHDFRAEVALGQGRIDTKIDKLNDKFDAQSAILHGRITNNRTKAQAWALGVAGVAIFILLGVVGWSINEMLEMQHTIQALTAASWAAPPMGGLP